jgi:hypothetical protein
MARSLYALPTAYLVEQGLHTRGDLAQVAGGPLRSDWERAGVDVTALAREVAAVADGLFEAQVETTLADLAVRSASRRSRHATAAAHGWLGWLDDLVAEAVAEGGPSPVLVSPRNPTRAKPSLVWVTARVRALLSDVRRERARLARFTGRPELLDRGEALLAELDAASLQARTAADRRTRAARDEAQARSRFVQVFHRLDRLVVRVAKVTGRTPPLAASRHVLRAEARRRDAAARRRKAVAPPRAGEDEDAGARSAEPETPAAPGGSGTTAPSPPG